MENFDDPDDLLPSTPRSTSAALFAYSLLDIPEELLTEIFKHLSAADVQRLASLISKEFSSTLKPKKPWGAAFKAKFPHRYNEMLANLRFAVVRQYLQEGGTNITIEEAKARAEVEAKRTLFAESNCRTQLVVSHLKSLPPDFLDDIHAWTSSKRDVFESSQQTSIMISSTRLHMIKDTKSIFTFREEPAAEDEPCVLFTYFNATRLPADAPKFYKGIKVQYVDTSIQFNRPFHIFPLEELLPNLSRWFSSKMFD